VTGDTRIRCRAGRWTIKLMRRVISTPADCPADQRCRNLASLRTQYERVNLDTGIVRMLDTAQDCRYVLFTT
jgi:hypothetical protein